jgi:hypothetical protein
MLHEVLPEIPAGGPQNEHEPSDLPSRDPQLQVMLDSW